MKGLRMNVRDFSKSAVRTVTPIVVGYIVTLLAKSGVTVDANAVTLAATPLVATAYYLVVRLIEEAVPAAGWLLGVPTKPQYDVIGAAKNAKKVVTAMATSELTKAADAAHVAVTHNNTGANVTTSNAKSATSANTATKSTSAKKAPAKKSAAPKKSAN